MDRLAANKRFLSNIYRKGPFEGHGFVCKPPAVPLWEGPDNDFTTSDRPVSQWIEWAVESYLRRVDLLAVVEHDDVPTCNLSTGTQIFAAAFGCPVHLYDDNNPCALPLVRTARDADQLEKPDIWTSPSLYRIFELGDALRRELGPEAILGPPDTQSGFDTACLVWDKASLFTSMMSPDEEESVLRLVRICTQLLEDLLDELHKEFPTMTLCGCPGVWSPPDMAPWYSNDECGAFSAELFERFCMPELLELSEHFGGMGMHCCADAEHQFAAFTRIPGLYAFNRVASKRGYGPILDHLAGPDGPVHVLAWLDEETIADLITRAPEGTRFVFSLMDADEDKASPWLERMRALSPRLN